MSAPRGFKNRAAQFKNQHKLHVGSLETHGSPVPEIILPVPAKITVNVNGVEFELDPVDMDLLESLGQGVHGTVDKMRHRPTATVMAVKRIVWKLNSNDQSTTLRRELEVSMQASRCPHVVKCYGALYKEAAVWICMEVMDTSLEKFYQTVYSNDIAMPEAVIGSIAFSVVSSLHFLKSELNVMHRDVKPSNILINRNGDVKICDFGISGRLVDSIARSQVGSRNYMAPERVIPEGQDGYNITSDVWSLGISMIELATGVFPYDAWKTPFQQMEQVVNGSPPRLPPGHQFSEEFEHFITSCLQKDSRQRPKYTDLLQHPFILRHAAVDVSEFVAAALDKLIANQS